MRAYLARGKRITVKSGYIPEWDMKTGAINYRLSQHHDSNLAIEFHRVAGIQMPERKGT